MNSFDTMALDAIRTFAEDDTEPRTTEYALGKTLALLVAAKKLMTHDFPRGVVFGTTQGGIRVQWLHDGREVRLIVPHAKEFRHTVYFEDGDDYGAVGDEGAEYLAQRLDWLVCGLMAPKLEPVK